MSGVAFESWCRAHAHPDASNGPPSPSDTSLMWVGQLLALGQQPPPKNLNFSHTKKKKKSNNGENGASASPAAVDSKQIHDQMADQFEFAPAGSEPPVSQTVPSTTPCSRPSPAETLAVPPAKTAEDVIVAAVRRAQNFTRAQLDAFGDALSPHRWVAVDQLSEEAEEVRLLVFFLEIPC